MKKFQIVLFFITVFILSAFEGGKDYAEFKKEPEYIINPTPSQTTYFEAYDQTMSHWGVDYEDLYIPTSHGTAHVIVSGPRNAMPIVLLNGMSSSSTMWYPNAKALTEHYRIFAIDLIVEPGKSFLTKKFKNISEIRDWYQEVFAALNLESYHLIGPSRGGWLAMDLALHHTGNLKSVILLSPVQTFVWIPPSPALLKNMMNVMYSREKRIPRTMSTLSNNTSRINEDFLEQYRLGKENDSLNKFVTGMRPFSKKELRTLDVPMLVLVGEDDIFNNRRTLRKAEKFIPKATAKMIHDSGHFLAVDQTEVVNIEILEFFKNVDGNQ